MTRTKATVAALVLLLPLVGSLGMAPRLWAQAMPFAKPTLKSGERLQPASPDAAMTGKTGGRLLDEASQRQRQRSSMRTREIRDSRLGEIGGYGLAAGMVLLAGVLAVRGRLALDLGMPRPAGQSTSARVARWLTGASLLLLAMSGVALIYGPDLLGDRASVLVGIVAVVVHAVSALALIAGVTAMGVLAAYTWSAGAMREVRNEPRAVGPLPVQRGLFAVIAAAVAVACVTGGALIAPFRLLSPGGLSVLEQLAAARLWDLGAGLVGVLSGIVSICMGTLRIVTAFPSADPTAARGSHRS